MSASAASGPPVVLTRRLGADDELELLLGRAGFTTLCWPASAIEPVAPPGGADRLRQTLARVDGVAFVSPASAEAASRLMSPLGEVLDGIGVVGVQGQGTAAALRRLGVSRSVEVAERPVAEGLAAVFVGRLPPGSSVLLLQGSLARPVLATALQEQGLAPAGLQVYRNLEPPGLARPARPLGAIVFCSPSAAERHLGANPWLLDVPAVAIGPTTAAALERLGHAHVHEAGQPTPEALCAATRRAMTG